MNVHTRSRWLVVTFFIPVLAVSLWAWSGAKTRAQDQAIRWDIVHVFFGQTAIVTEGGEASARANDDSRITLTGKGTFVPGEPRAVAGGGTWTTRNAKGDVTGSGTYTITELLYWLQAPGAQGPPVVSQIVRGDYARTRAGLAVFRVRYSNGSEGVLVVSCRLGGTPTSVFEGISASMGFVAYAKPEPDVAGVDANRTLFSIPRE